MEKNIKQKLSVIFLSLIVLFTGIHVHFVEESDTYTEETIVSTTNTHMESCETTHGKIHLKDAPGIITCPELTWIVCIIAIFAHLCLLGDTEQVVGILKRILPRGTLPNSNESWYIS